MTNLFSSNYLSRKPIEQAMEEFSKNFSPEMKILDIGCGNKPYAGYFKCNYTGLDPFKDTKADVIADAWNIPFPDNEFDGIILNQSLEHIKKTKETISEIKRTLKPRGLCIVTVPQTMKNHSIPVPSQDIELNNFDKNKIPYWNNDFYRFTKFGLIYLFREFKIIDLKESNGYIGTMCQLSNYFLTSVSAIRKLFIPLYFLANITGLTFDKLFQKLSTCHPIAKKFYELIYLSLTLNYILIIKNDDKK